MPKYDSIKKVLVAGSGPIVIGQAAEFDYAGTQACLALKEENIEVVLINDNPATIMTDESIADHVYIEPLTVESVEKVIEKERPDGFIGTLGGQTGLNLSVQLYEQDIFKKYDVKLLGTSVESIQKGEDRESFRQLMVDLNEPIPESHIVSTLEEAQDFVKQIGYPVILRPAYTLGGAGGGFATDDKSLAAIVEQGLAQSPIQQVLVEKSIKGWKEIEYEVMRDENDTCTIVCNMENLDPVGVHTGDSIVVAPSQTLTDRQYQMLRDVSRKVIRALDVIGGCNIQFAMDPHSDKYYIIEVNPRVSRSSALASKATGYPIARIAAKCAIGYHLDELMNPITTTTKASFEPALDYVVVKLPRFPFDKFSTAERHLGTQMKATGEVMAIDRNFQGALNKALRSLDSNIYRLLLPSMTTYSDAALQDELAEPTDTRLYILAEAFRRGYSTEKVYEMTQVDPWFLYHISNIVSLEQEIATYSLASAPISLLKEAKQMNMSDQTIAEGLGASEQEVRHVCRTQNIHPVYKLVDTCAAEFDAVTPYYYSTWHGFDEAESSNKKKILVIGSGPIRIGQGIEFDYCSVHAALAVQKLGYEAIVINNNPETVSTDYSVADRLYFEPLAAEDVLAVIEKEQVEGVVIQFGGQTAINLAEALQQEGVKLLGTDLDAVDRLEDRQRFYDLLNELNVPHISGETVDSSEQLFHTAETLGFPVLIRPSYVIGGQSMFICHNKQELKSDLEKVRRDTADDCWPLLVDQYLPGLECEVDVISDGKTTVVPGIFEHIEKAGVHSGDSIAMLPPITMDEETKKQLITHAKKIAETLPIQGMMNIQFVVANGTVYVLEVNPRASRTVPIVSKVTGVAMIEWATHVQLGVPLTDMTESEGLLDEPNVYAAKVPVFSAAKLKDVDHVLGPEMKSTGERLGLAWTPEEALAKGISLDERLIERVETDDPWVLCSVADREKEESIPLVQSLINRGFRVAATEGTARCYRDYGLDVDEIPKDRTELERVWKAGVPSFVINIANHGSAKEKVGFFLRELAVRYNVPCFTSLDTAEMSLSLLEKKLKLSAPQTLTSYRSGADSSLKEVEA
ncbi:carbamoyl-phosphate synthase (glutamine-hydrolyzing) large subunit [Texcoconibacillus texcoconensis]|uniref:Carbamoyl phosphate synthase large chain n=1 Tax=Texcoconibacillus texcoconensis TaxID=1095777 RepID=A0A840QS96_9BACI|nr:carbamoyl-phosphate synthase (glutamine-hydrolyzing) large subunit [Texcoconibacillus texcoconensis]MBB5174171.1 carbamoyl-phosphate synthase large subunit [Texcoconibacillus texcoconensis]